MKILVGCEESQAVTIELRKQGHEAYSCDLIESSGGHPEWHLQMDVFEAIELKDWDVGIFFTITISPISLHHLEENEKNFIHLVSMGILFWPAKRV